jgi:predicted DCC family thiol-disulfide oxidoreductase YuxK
MSQGNFPPGTESSRAGRRHALRRPALVLYDGQCLFCQRSVAILKRLDWLGRLGYLDAREPATLARVELPLNRDRLLEEMHLVTPDGRHVYPGFAAFRWMAWRLPLLWPIAPLLYLPGVARTGQRLYRWIARNRFGLVPCKEGSCQVSLSPPAASRNGQPVAARQFRR